MTPSIISVSSSAWEISSDSTTVLEWLRSYLTACTQYVSVGICCSITATMTMFGPQAAPVLYVHCPGRNIDQLLRKKIPPIWRRHTTVYRIDPDSLHCLASLIAGADAVTSWHIRNYLLLNPNKTEALIASFCQQVAKLDTSNWIALSSSIVLFSSKLRVLWVTLDDELTFDDQIFWILRAFNYHQRTLCHICPLGDQDTFDHQWVIEVLTHSLWSAMVCWSFDTVSLIINGFFKCWYSLFDHQGLLRCWCWPSLFDRQWFIAVLIQVFLPPMVYLGDDTVSLITNGVLNC